MSLRTRVMLVYLACCVLWGSTWLAAKIGLDEGGLPPLFFAGVRMLLAGALLTPFAARLPRRASFARIAFVGLLQIAIPYGMIFVGQQTVPSGLSAVFFATFPVWLLLVARILIPKETITTRKLAAVALGLGGVLVLQIPRLTDPASSGASAMGGAWIVLGAVVCAVANVLARRDLGHVSPMVLTWLQTLVGGAALLAASFVLERPSAVHVSPTAAGALLYLAIFGTVFTYLGLYWILPRVPVAAIGAIPLVDTTVAVILGTAVRHEAVGWTLLAGGALVLAGAALANLRVAAGEPVAA
jgi:drug/metabolite transporter (DMT)-like permease